MEPSKILIVDGSAVCYAAFYSMGHLGTRSGIDTGIYFGFFSQLQNVCRTHQVAHIAFCWDSRKSLRKKAWPLYKRGRQDKPKEVNLLSAYAKFNMLREVLLPELGFCNSFMRTGYEADDLIASLCRFPGPVDNQHFIIMSGDQDLYQLLTPQISMYSPAKKKLYTHRDFQAEYGIDPLFWSSVKAIAGCTSDDVDGIPSIGVKRAIAYIKNCDSQRHEKIDTPEAKQIIKRNKPLVTLPYAGTPKYDLDWSEPPSYSAWIELCEKMEFQSFLRHPETWECIFSGVPPSTGLEKIKIGRRK